MTHEPTIRDKASCSSCDALRAEVATLRREQATAVHQLFGALRLLKAAEALCATLEGKNEQNNAIVVAIARMCDGEQPSDFMLSFGIVRAVDDLRASRDEALRQVEALEREVTQITAILDAERAMWAPELAARAAQEQS